ncbi:MAG: SET domain-containing protein-lysine N-methyltransferase [Candidatus Taylorbacteria bacterium]|nr:SET domain-containing protein-lysine N-methyltransferase [Candidatus Taylorbacteria bacterium]
MIHSKILKNVGIDVNYMNNKSYQIGSEVTVKESLVQGKGVFALRDFKKDELVYVVPRGRFVKKSEVKGLSEYEKEHLDRVDVDTYELMQEPACFINHSCEPNIIEKLMPKGIEGYAFRNIKNGEEVGVDYRVRGFDDWKMNCKCGSKFCTGIVIGNFFTLSLKLQKKYLPFAPKFIQEEFEKKKKARCKTPRF